MEEVYYSTTTTGGKRILYIRTGDGTGDCKTIEIDENYSLKVGEIFNDKKAQKLIEYLQAKDDEIEQLQVQLLEAIKQKLIK